MSPSLNEGDIVVSLKGNDFKTGDVVAFYYNNKILVKRVMALAGDWINIDENGVVYVNNEEIDEPYISEKALGECNIKLPYQVPESRIFVMGDNRATSVDSRNTSVGCVAEEQIVGKIRFRVWPLSQMGVI
jgi:signal peptidase I